MFNVQINNRLKDIKGTAFFFCCVSIIAVVTYSSLKPVMDGYIFKDLDSLDSSEYCILATNLWQNNFRMFELREIMRQIKKRIC